MHTQSDIQWRGEAKKLISFKIKVGLKPLSEIKWRSEVSGNGQ